MKVWVVLSVHANREAWIDSVHSTQAGAAARCDEANLEKYSWVYSDFSEHQVLGGELS